MDKYTPADTVIVTIDGREVARVNIERDGQDLYSISPPLRTVTINMDGRAIAQALAPHIPSVVS